jgi:LacI family transcriptional regulator
MSLTPSGRAAARLQAPLLTPPGGVVARASSDTLAHPHPLVRLALIHVRQNIGHSFGAPEIAAALGISRSYLDHLFVHETGHSIGKEILAQRLREVKRLLADSDLSIAAIAFQTGFCNAGHLSNTFRRAEGLSPRAWRHGHAP